MSHPLLSPIPVRYKLLDLSELFPTIGTIRLRSLTTTEKLKYELGNRHKLGSEEYVAAELTRPAELLCLVCVDEAGRPLFTATDAIALSQQDGKLIEILCQTAMLHVGLSIERSIFADLEAAEKKSQTIGSSASPSS